MNQATLPSQADLDRIFILKHGRPESTGWSPRTRYQLGYFTPDDVYEATVERLVNEGDAWADVGTGRDLFPSNRKLAQLLADRCGLLVGVDPDDTLDENPFVHQRVKSTIDDFHSDQTFDVVTLRMVVEHIADPKAAAAALARMTKPGGKVIIYTVNQWTPVAIIASIVPFGLHHAIKRILWKTEAKDTFPTLYRMNTRKRLAQVLQDAGFNEHQFARLDDCRTFGRFRLLHYLELRAWKLLRALGLSYPENCLLGIYERVGFQENESSDIRRNREFSDRNAS